MSFKSWPRSKAVLGFYLYPASALQLSYKDTLKPCLSHSQFPSTSTKVTELKERLRPMRGFWVSLPHTICNDEKMAADVTNEDRCWNGQTRGRWARSEQKAAEGRVCTGGGGGVSEWWCRGGRMQQMELSLFNYAIATHPHVLYLGLLVLCTYQWIKLIWEETLVSVLHRKRGTDCPPPSVSILYKSTSIFSHKPDVLAVL